MRIVKEEVIMLDNMQVFLVGMGSFCFPVS